MANKWGVWCVRSTDSKFGFAETWLKDHGKRQEYDTEDEAVRRADNVQQAMISPNLTYYAKEITA